MTRAISDYLATNQESGSIGAIRPRLGHVVRYIATLPDASVRCEQVNEAWIGRFRKWLAAEPVVSSAGNARERARSAGTIENSVLQLAAAINSAYPARTSLPAQFKPIQMKELTHTPRRRLSIEDLAAAFRYAIDPRYPTKRGALHRFLMLAVATAARPDAVHDFSTDPAREQWHADSRVLALNWRGRRQTRKYRATLIAPRQIVDLLNKRKGYFVGVSSVRSAFDSMCDSLGWPKDGENGMKLIRRSVAQLLRDPARGVPSEQIELQLGHRRIDSVTDLYAAFDPGYLKDATAALEAIIDEIEARVPGSFHRSDTGEAQPGDPNTPSPEA